MHPLLAAMAAAPIVGATPIRVVIVDDCADVRFLLATLIELDGRFEVVAEASDGASALAAVGDTDPDVVLVDLRLGGESGTSLIRDLRQGGATVYIVVVTASTAPNDHAAALRAGADAVQNKCSMTTTMVDELAELVDHRSVTGPNDLMLAEINFRTTAGSTLPSSR